jgi:hypothetical protein
MKIDRETYFKNLLETTSIHKKARIAVTTGENVRSTKIKGLPDDSIDPTRATGTLCCGRMQLNGRRRLWRKRWVSTFKKRVPPH